MHIIQMHLTSIYISIFLGCLTFVTAQCASVGQSFKFLTTIDDSTYYFNGVSGNTSDLYPNLVPSSQAGAAYELSTNGTATDIDNGQKLVVQFIGGSLDLRLPASTTTSRLISWLC